MWPKSLFTYIRPSVWYVNSRASYIGFHRRAKVILIAIQFNFQISVFLFFYDFHNNVNEDPRLCSPLKAWQHRLLQIVCSVAYLIWIFSLSTRFCFVITSNASKPVFITKNRTYSTETAGSFLPIVEKVKSITDDLEN